MMTSKLRTSRSGGKSTQINSEMHDRLVALKAQSSSPISDVFPLNTSLEWEGSAPNLWPAPDACGWLRPGELFIVEIDDQADPGRSIVKYWPLLKRVARGDYEVQRIVYLAISSPNATFGAGYEALADFCGAEFSKLFGSRFAFLKTTLRGPSGAVLDAARLVETAVEYFRTASTTEFASPDPKP